MFNETHCMADIFVTSTKDEIVVFSVFSQKLFSFVKEYLDSLLLLLLG